MGLFGTREKINLDEPGEVKVLAEARQAVPDVGEYFLDWIGEFLTPEMYSRLKGQVDSLRGANGLVIPNHLLDVPLMRKRVPLSFLAEMEVRAWIPLTVWGSYPCRGRDLKTLERTLRGCQTPRGTQLRRRGRWKRAPMPTLISAAWRSR